MRLVIYEDEIKTIVINHVKSFYPEVEPKEIYCLFDNDRVTIEIMVKKKESP